MSRVSRRLGTKSNWRSGKSKAYGARAVENLKRNTKSRRPR